MNSTETRWVLIAEDDDEIRSLIKESILMEAEGFPISIVEARDGAEALAETTARQFHCVITDLKMPKMNGEEFLRSLQENPLNSKTPTLVISGTGPFDLHEISDRYSNVQVIPKPFGTESLAKLTLEEVKLGHIDDRVGITLIEPISRYLAEFLELEFRLVAEEQNPQVKRLGDKPIGDIHLTMVLSTGKLRSHFTVSFDHSLLNHARTNYFQLPGAPSITLEDTARRWAGVILDLARSEIEAAMGGYAYIASFQVLVADSTFADATDESRAKTSPDALYNCTGIAQVIECSYGRVVAATYSRFKS